MNSQTLEPIEAEIDLAAGWRDIEQAAAGQSNQPPWLNSNETSTCPSRHYYYLSTHTTSLALFVLGCKLILMGDGPGQQDRVEPDMVNSQLPPSPPPAISRLLKRSPVRDPHEAKALVNGRRESFLQDRKDRLAQRRQLHDQVVARGRVDVPAKLEALRQSLSAAQAARNAIYAQIAANGSKEVARAHLVVSQNKEKVRLERETKRLALEMKLAEAHNRREHALKNRKFVRRNSSLRRSPAADDGMDCDVATTSKIQDPTDAATHIQRFWRSRLAFNRAKKFASFHLDYETAGSVPFDVVADVIKGKDIIRAAGQILSTLGLNECSPTTTAESLCRIFLSTFMIIGHPKDILMQHGVLEDKLSAKAKLFSSQFSRWLHMTAQGKSCCQSKLWNTWNAFLSAFESWKQDDSANLLEVMVAQYCELDLIYQIVKSDSDPIVAAEYHTAIKDNQLTLLARIRRIAGDETVPLIRKAVSSARRKRLPRGRKAVTAKSAQSDSPIKSPSIDAVQFFSLGQRQTRLSNRQLIHEISLDPMYQITKPKLSESETLLEESMKQNFFTSLQSEIRANRSVSWIPIVVQECKMRLLRLVMPNSPTFAVINADFDIPYIEAQCQQNCYDYLAFTTTVINMMRALCSPARDGLVSDIELLRGSDEVDLFGKRINSIFEVLDILLLDSANFHLSMSASRLLPEAIPYEQKKFQEDLNAGTATLDKTRPFMLLRAAELRSEADARDTEGIGRPSSRPTACKIFHTALAHLLATSETLPETFVLDCDRISRYRADFTRIVSTVSYLMISRNLMRTHQRFLNLLTWTSLRDRLSILLSGTDAADPTSIAAEINNHLDLAYSGSEPARLERHATLSNLIKNSQSLDPVQKLLKRRLQALMITRMSGTEVTSLKIAAAGFDDLTNDVQSLLGEVEIFARINWNCYKSWYEELLA